MLRGYVAGALYFAANLWWLWTASVPGTIALVLWFSLFWAIAAGLIRGLKLLSEPAGDASERSGWRDVYRVFAIAAVWVAAEWLRCYVASGFPWMPLGTTQSPVLFMCQVADIGGPWIVSSWVALPNALAATLWLRRISPVVSWKPQIAVASALVAVAIYGAWRLQTTETIPGPRVMIVQSDFPHQPGGAPTVDRPHAVEFFVNELTAHLPIESVQLVVLPEAALPPINDEARRELARSAIGPFLESTYHRLMRLALDHDTTLLVGGNAVTGWTTQGKEHIGSEIRNSAYFFNPQVEPPLARYDKVFLARFSERAPLTIGPEWLRRFAAFISAPRSVQPMFAGELRELRPFQLNAPDAKSPTRFITPICLENIDPAIMAQLVRGSSAGGKQADFVANISNDGWFSAQEKHQHLQTTIFRCIENRVPMVRCSNTGISAFIDSTGRVEPVIGASQSGVTVAQIELDGRRTFYTRHGDVFAMACVAFAAAAVVWKFVQRRLA